MNSVANGKVYQRSPFKKLYIQSAAGDAGGAIGSAMVVAQTFPNSKFKIQNSKLAAQIAPSSADPSPAIPNSAAKNSSFIIPNSTLAPLPRHHCRHAYWGPEYTEADFTTLLESEKARLDEAGCHISLHPDAAPLCDAVARAISKARSLAGSRAALNGDRAPWATVPSLAIRAAPT